MKAKKKAPAKKAARKFTSGATRSSTAKTAKPRKQPEKDPNGGLTAQGRKAFARKEGSHLRPGVQGPADTPEKMRRKGSFLRRHFAHPRGPVEREGEPTRLALSAHAWGEPVPKHAADVKKLAAKGARLLDDYHRSKGRKFAAKKRSSNQE
jgi:hypothetical protein